MKNLLLSVFASALLIGQVFAADEMTAENVMFSSETNTLIIPKVYVMDASGNMTQMVSAKLVLSKGDQPYEFKVMELNPLADDASNVDEFGCVLPETWHAAMGHCMVQN